MSGRSAPVKYGSPILLIFTAIAGSLATGCAASGSQGSPPPPADPVAESSADAIGLTANELESGGITVDAVRSAARTSYLTASAVLQLDDTRTARVGSLVDGVVVDIPVQVGARVEKDARLASIHTHRVHEAQAEYRRALAERRRAASELAFMKDAEGRASRLFAAKAASRQEAERAQADRVSAEEALVIAESEVRRASDELTHLGIALETSAAAVEDTVPVTASLGGVVLERLVTSGTAVVTGAPLFVVSDLSSLWAIAEFDESQLAAIKAGSPVELTVAAYPDRVFAGRLISAAERVNPETRRVTVRIEVANADGWLKPEMFATVRVPTETQERAVSVPTSAVQTIEHQTVVFVEQQPGRFAIRPVTTGMEEEGRVEIREGLADGERVALTGAFLLKSKALEADRPE